MRCTALDNSGRIVLPHEVSTPQARKHDALDGLLAAATAACDKPLALISLSGQACQWFMTPAMTAESSQDLHAIAAWSSAICRHGRVEIDDLRHDPRSSSSALAASGSTLTSYAGFPLYRATGTYAGSLCVIDHASKALSDCQRRVLTGLATAAVEIIEASDIAHERAISDARFRALADAAPLGVFEIDASGQWLYANDTWQGMIGKDVLPAANTVLAQLVHPDDRFRLLRDWARLSHRQTPVDSRFRMQRPDGSIRHARALIRAIIDQQGQSQGCVGSVEELPEPYAQGQAGRKSESLFGAVGFLAEHHELLRVTLQSIGDAVITVNARGYVTWLNPAAERMTGWRSADAAGHIAEEVFKLVTTRTRETAENPIVACLARTEAVTSGDDISLLGRDGRELEVEKSTAPIQSRDGDIIGAVLVLRDVTEKRRLSHELVYRASHDSLTGLANRSEFELRLEQARKRAVHEGSVHALMLIDLDQLKLVNDTCGHTVGDALLQQAARQLKCALREHDTLARIGGDEFAVILHDCTPEDARRIAQEICTLMDDFRWFHENRRFRISASIGLVSIDARWREMTPAFQAADSACHAAKTAGRNRVHEWRDSDASMHERNRESRWATRLSDALDEGRFVLYAQRINSLSGDNRALHAEVLIRLNDEQQRIVEPGVFLSAAERFHLATRLDRWVLREVIDYIRQLKDLRTLERLCVNLSGQSLGDPSFLADTLDALGNAGAELCNRLCLEITETAAITNIAEAVSFTQQARKLGVRIALDDFGAGAASFGYLRRLPVDVLKIDGQFVRNMIDDPLDDAAVRCFVEVARVTGIATVAEHVDRADVLERIRNCGVDYVQGFLMHQPEPLSQLVPIN